MKAAKGKVRIAGKEHAVEVRKGVHYIDGVTVEEFTRRLPKQLLEDLALVGVQALRDERGGKKKSKYQNLLDRIDSSHRN